MTEKTPRRHRWLVWVGGALVLLIAAELAARYVRSATLRQPFLQPDARTGWSNVPGRDVVRINAAGERWRVVIDRNGNRQQPAPPAPRQAMLVIGDSFAFGEGVDIERRFDAEVARRNPALRIDNQSVSGFGLDQAYLRVERTLGDYDRPEHLVLVLLYRNDFEDVQMRRSTRRPKPWLSLATGAPVWTPPSPGWQDVLGEASALATPLKSLLPDQIPIRRGFEGSAEVIEHLLRTIRARAAKAKLVLAHVGRRSLQHIPAELSGARFCAVADLCIDLDTAVPADAVHYLPDGHWSAKGQEAAGRLVADELVKVLPASPAR